jgi:hypothetical protein
LRAFVIGHLLVELDGLCRFVAQLHREAAPCRRDRQVTIPEPPHQIERFSHRLLVRQPRRVLGDVLLDRRPHLRRCAEESVGGHQPRQPLVRTLEVVRVDEERQPPLQIVEVGEDRSRKKFVPQRLPKPLHLPQRLRMLRPALDMPDALAPQLFFKFRRAAPRRVLPSLIGQDLLRCSKRRDPFSKRVHHQRRSLMVRQRVRHQKPRVVVHERRQVHALVPPEQKREDVRLPELVRGRAFKPALRMLPRHRWR